MSSKTEGAAFGDATAQQAAAKRLLAYAERAGASSAEVMLSHTVGSTVTVRQQALECVERHDCQSVQLVVYQQQRSASVSATDMSDAALQALADKAMSIARVTEIDPHAGLPEPEYLATDHPDLDLYHPWAASQNELMTLALQCEGHALGLDPRIKQSEGAEVSTVAHLGSYANSDGFMGAYPTSLQRLSCRLVAESKSEAGMARDYEYTVARAAADLEKAEQVALSAVRRTVDRLGARPLSTRQCPIVFAPAMARGLVGQILSALAGGRQYRKASFLQDSLGTQVLPDWLGLEEHPHLIGGLGSAPFDHEGVQTKPAAIVSQGVVQKYLLSSYSARRLGLAPTGNAGGARNVQLIGPTQPLADLLKTMGQGLLVTELIGHGINAVTGDYSRGAFGYWVERGEIQYPVHEVTIAGNLKDMLQGITALGDDIDKRSHLAVGSILVNGMTLAGGA